MFQPSIYEETTSAWLLPCTSGSLKPMESDANLLFAMEKIASFEKQLKSCKRELAAIKETHTKELMTLKDDCEYLHNLTCFILFSVLTVVMLGICIAA